MSTLAYIIIFTLLGSVVSLLGGVLLLYKEKFAIKIAHFLSSFAAGALLGTAFFDLLPESMAEESNINVFFWALLGILAFFILERFIHWFHHHHEHLPQETKAIIPLITIGDTIHNFIDGVAIAGTFLISIPLGIVTTLAVGAHEIPQEIGDFGVMLKRGVNRKKVLLINFISAIAAVLGAILTYLVGDAIKPSLPIFLSLTAGFFIYIALSDLIPEIHNEEKRSTAAIESALVLLGVFVIYFVVTLLEGK